MAWPDIAGLHQYLTAHGLLTQTAKPPGAEPISTEQSNFASGDLHPAQNPGGLTPLQRFAQDWVGNSIAIIILLVLAVSLLGVMAQITRANSRPKPWPRWSIPVLVVIGLLVAAYMSYIELTLTDAVCGPVGDCNTVQQSSYATLFGVLPIAVLGIAGYLAIGAAWLTASYGPKKWQPGSTYTLWVMAIAGTLFSLYLTFLEPFVIGASCAWCLTSAVIMALLLWAATSSLIQRRGDRGVRPAR